MGIGATNQSNTDFKQPSPGNHLGRLYQIIDIGTQHGEYKGEPTARRQAIFRWELPYETEVFEGVTKPLIVSKFYTLSTSEKANLRRDIQSWLSRTLSETEAKFFDVTTLLNKTCMLSIIHNEGGKAKVEGIGAIPKGMPEAPIAFNPVSFFSLDKWDPAAFDKLPGGFQTLIKKSDEYFDIHKIPQQQPALAPVPVTPVVPSKAKVKVDDGFEDDIPF